MSREEFDKVFHDNYEQFKNYSKRYNSEDYVGPIHDSYLRVVRHIHKFNKPSEAKSYTFRAIYLRHVELNRNKKDTGEFCEEQSRRMNYNEAFLDLENPDIDDYDNLTGDDEKFFD